VTPSRLDLDVSLPLDRFILSVRWRTEETALGIFGPSGAGKSSLLESIAGLRSEARGRIEVAGKPWLDSGRGLRLPPEKRGVGYVPQEALLFPHRDVMGNLLAGRRRAARRPAKRLSIERVLEVLELADLASRRVETLSGGERRRVALGRALCSAPDLLLLDEPLAGLDAALRRKVLSYVLRIQEEFAIPTICVSHDAAEIRALCREVAVLVRGGIAALGRPDEILIRPDILPISLEEGYENVLRGRVALREPSLLHLELDAELRLAVPAAGEAHPGDEVSVAVRAGDLILATHRPEGLSAQNILPAEIVEIRDATAVAGADGPVQVIVALGAARAPIVATVTRRARQQLDLKPGARVYLVFKTQACRLLATRRMRPDDPHPVSVAPRIQRP
jgi:molybdate transport system ATP-binding protein